MAEQVKYLVTVDATTGSAVRIERLGAAGELTEVPIPVPYVAASQYSQYPAGAPPVPVTQPPVPTQQPQFFPYWGSTPPYYQPQQSAYPVGAPPVPVTQPPVPTYQPPFSAQAVSAIAPPVPVTQPQAGAPMAGPTEATADGPRRAESWEDAQGEGRPANVAAFRAIR